MKAIQFTSNIFGIIGVLLFGLSGCMMNSENLIVPLCIFAVSMVCLAVFGYTQKYIEKEQFKQHIREKYGYR